MTGWKEYKLRDIADVRDGTHDSPKPVTIGKMLITSRHIKNGKIDFSQAYNISIEDYKFVNKRSKVDKYDVLFSMIGTIGETCIVSEEPEFAIKNVALFKTSGDLELAKWIYYYFKSDFAKNELNSSIKGSTQEYVSLGDLRNFPINLPPAPEQKAIVAVLSSLDDKIDLLHRQNATLEAMAEALFRQWFVVEAQEEWDVGQLGSLFNIASGKGLKQSDFSEVGQYPVFGANGKIGNTNLFLYCEKLIYTGRVGTLGNLFIVDNEKAWLSDNTLVFTDISSFYFVYFALKSQRLEELNVGSTQPLIRQSDIKEIEIIIPPKMLLEKFEKIAQDIFDKMKANQPQICTLEKLRDTLLPKLMSGEVRVALDC